MVIVLEESITQDQSSALEAFLAEHHLGARRERGERYDVVVTTDNVEAGVPSGLADLPGVRTVVPITRSYLLASRDFRSGDTVVESGAVRVGTSRFVLFAGPCAVEDADQMEACAAAVKAAGGTVLRGGSFKPRTSPYSFQGLGEEGLRLHREAADRYGLLMMSEVLDREDLDLVAGYADILQVGSRNMQNFPLLKALGKQAKPIMLKRGLASTREEFLLAAEYILMGGNDQVVLCERGIRSFDPSLRNNLDLASVCLLKEMTHLPVVVDPSHATGTRSLVLPMARAAAAVGADGIMVEVHPAPERALSDGPQALHIEDLPVLARDLSAIAPLVGRIFGGDS